MTVNLNTPPQPAQPGAAFPGLVVGTHPEGFTITPNSRPAAELVRDAAYVALEGAGVVPPGEETGLRADLHALFTGYNDPNWKGGVTFGPKSAAAIAEGMLNLAVTNEVASDDPSDAEARRTRVQADAALSEIFNALDRKPENKSHHN